MLKTFGFRPTLAFQMPAPGHDSVDKMEKRSEAHLLVMLLAIFARLVVDILLVVQAKNMQR